jgi:uncharacterized FlgJ-related protein
MKFEILYDGYDSYFVNIDVKKSYVQLKDICKILSDDISSWNMKKLIKEYRMNSDIYISFKKREECKRFIEEYLMRRIVR